MQNTIRMARRFMVMASLAACLCQAGCAVLIVGAAGGAAAGAATSARESQKDDHSAMTYVGTVLANVLYFPAKVLFAAGGAAVSGIAYVVTLGDESASSEVWQTTVEGDYVVTPDMIEGDRPVRFAGK